MGSIETGVDRLVKLIQSKGKTSVDQAAKELGVSKLVITEWAEFLHDEKLIDLEYSLSKTYLKPKSLSSSDVDKKGDNYNTRKDTFVRKVDTAVKQIEQQKDSFDSIKKEFDVLQKQISGSMDSVKDELRVLKKYEDVKKGLDEDIREQTEEYEDHIKSATAAISHEQKKYEDLLNRIRDEEERLDEEIAEVQTLQKIEDEFTKRAESLNKFVKEAHEQIKRSESSIDSSSNEILNLRKDAKELREELEDMKKKFIQPLEVERDSHKEEIDHLKDSIVAKVKEIRTAAGDDYEEALRIAKKFENFFNKRMDAEKLMAQIDNDLQSIAGEFEELKKSAISFKIASKSNVGTQLKQLEKKYDEVNKKRDKYQGQLKKLIDLIIH